MTDYNPFAERDVKHPTSDFETVVHLCKGSLGSGILAMPFAFFNIGLWLGLPATIGVGTLCSYCIHMLVKSSQTLCYRCRIPSLNYAHTAEQAFANDPKAMIKTGRFMRYIVNTFLVVDLLGTVCTYFVNVGRNFQQVLDSHLPDNGISLRLWIIILTAPMIFLVLIRDLKYLVPFSLAANIFIFTGLIITFTFIFMGLPSLSERPAMKPVAMWPLFFGTSIFALENIGVVLPCENEMKHPEHFTGCPSVLVIAMTFVLSLYVILGFFGYLRFGTLTEPNVTLNLPTENLWAQAAKLLVGLAVYFTILLQFYVPINIIWNGMKEKIADKWKLITEYSLRIAAILLCAGIALAFPDLGPLISLIGAVCLSTLGLILPAILDLVVFRIDPGWGFMKFHLFKDIFIIMLGLTGFVSGSVQSIQEFEL